MKLTLALFAALTAASAAQAQTAPLVYQSTRIEYADLNLDSHAGKVALERRIKSAIRKVCPAEAINDNRMVDYASQQRCKDGVRAQVARQLPR